MFVVGLAFGLMSFGRFILKVFQTVLDCDAFDMQKKIDVSMRSAVLLDHVGVTCMNKNELLVSWEQPNGNEFIDKIKP